MQCYKQIPQQALSSLSWAVRVTGIIMSMMIMKYRSLSWWYAIGHIILINFDSHHCLYHLSSLSVLPLSHKQHHTPASLIHETSNTMILSSLFMKAMRSRSKSITLIDIIITTTTIIIWVVVSLFLIFSSLFGACNHQLVIHHHQSSSVISHQIHRSLIHRGSLCSRRI